MDALCVAAHTFYSSSSYSLVANARLSYARSLNMRTSQLPAFRPPSHVSTYSRSRPFASRKPHRSRIFLPLVVASMEQVEETYIMIKPDGVQRGLEHYKDLQSRPFFPKLTNYITSGPVVCMAWEGVGIVASARKLIGATNPLDAKPGTIRGDLAVHTGRNVVHGSDSPENGKREIEFAFLLVLCWWDPEGLGPGERKMGALCVVAHTLYSSSSSSLAANAQEFPIVPCLDLFRVSPLCLPQTPQATSSFYSSKWKRLISRLGQMEYIMVLEGVGIVPSARKLIGDAKPGTIRGDLDVHTGRNVVHGSDIPENGKREIALWFKEGELCERTPTQESWVKE
ncbi:nucleoside diphosphate kinase [Striga asiatica]|uniref:Nucleoside diphosphate kinase n=1 Tax=Striga asiatica TaxID=4170 RepID=A0A5A7PVE7_STRAF|nr:nucleoside diphosphate kinase [Striga asiatica]